MKAHGLKFFFIALSYLVCGGLHAQDPSFPEKDFSQVRKYLCNPDQIQTYKELGKTCEFPDFTVRGEDLRGDGQRIWFFYGPSVECGAHGNCPLTLVEKRGNKWTPLSLEPCNNEDTCLKFGNNTFSKVLPTSHQGFRDLLISADSGSFFWVKDVYEWNGRQYLRKNGATTYFFYDGDKDRLVEVSKKRYESCVKEGKNCLN